MTVSAIGALGAQNNTTGTSATSGTAITGHKHGVHSLKGNLAIAASDALSNLGSSAVNHASSSFASVLSTVKAAV